MGLPSSCQISFAKEPYKNGLLGGVRLKGVVSELSISFAKEPTKKGLKTPD